MKARTPGPASGFVLLPVVIFLAVLAILLSVSAYEGVRSEVRAHLDQERRYGQELLRQSLALAKSELRKLFRSDVCPEPDLVFAPRSYALDFRGERFVARVEIDALGLEPEPVRAMIRPSAAARPSAALLDRHSLARAASLPESSWVDTLGTSLADSPVDANDLIRELLVDAGCYEFGLRSAQPAVEKTLRHLDATARLCRTHAHPERLSGPDRLTPHPVVPLLTPGFSGRFRLSASLYREASPRPLSELEHEVPVFTRTRLSHPPLLDRDSINAIRFYTASARGPENLPDCDYTWGEVRADGPAGPARARSELLAFGVEAWGYPGLGREVRAVWLDRASQLTFLTADGGWQYAEGDWRETLGSAIQTSVETATGRLCLDEAGGLLLIPKAVEAPVRAISPGLEISNAIPIPGLAALLVSARDGLSLVSAEASTTVIETPVASAWPRDLTPDGSYGVWSIEGGALRHGELISPHELRWSAACPLEFEVRSVRSVASLELAVLESESGEVQLFRRGSRAPRPASIRVPLPGTPLELSRQPLGLWCRVGSGLVWVPVLRTEPKLLDLTGCLRRGPRVSESARFHAPLVRDLEATVDGHRHEAQGTVNRGGSVLSADDRSDVLVDGLILTPNRRETLRYEVPVSPGPGGVASLDRPSPGSLLVKVARSAQTAPEPGRSRILLRIEHEGRLRFRPAPEWLDRFGLFASDQRVIGPEFLEAQFETPLERWPADASWRLRRRLLVSGEWQLTSPTTLETRIVAPARPEVILSIADDFSPGAWQWLHWSVSPDELILASARQEGVVPQPDADFFRGFEFEAASVTIELGGELGAKAFRGTVQSLLIDRLGPAPQSTGLTRSPGIPDAVWLVESLGDAPGREILALVATGAGSDDSELRWRVSSAMPGDTWEGWGWTVSPQLERPRRPYRIELWLDSNSSGHSPRLESLDLLEFAPIGLPFEK